MSAAGTVTVTSIGVTDVGVSETVTPFNVSETVLPPTKLLPLIFRTKVVFAVASVGVRLVVVGAGLPATMLNGRGGLEVFP